MFDDNGNFANQVFQFNQNQANKRQENTMFEILRRSAERIEAEDAERGNVAEIPF